MNEKSLFKCFGPLRYTRYTDQVSESTRNDQAGIERWSQREQRRSACHSSRLEVSLQPSSLAVVVETLKPLQNITRPRWQSGGSSRHWRAHTGETGAPHARRPSEFGLLGRLDFNQSTECRFPGTDRSERTCFSFFFYHNVFFFFFF